MLSSISSAMRGGIWHTQSNPGNLQYLGDHNSPPQRPTLRSLQCQSMKTLPKSTSLGNLQYLGDQSSPPQRPTLAMKTLPKSKSLDGIDQYGRDSTQPPKTHFTSSQTRSNREVRKQFIQQGYPHTAPRGSADEGEGEGKGGDAMRPSRAIAGMLSSISSAMRGSLSPRRTASVSPRRPTTRLPHPASPPPGRERRSVTTSPRPRIGQSAFAESLDVMDVIMPLEGYRGR